MLTNLHIENVAVIESADIDFSAGFNVMTGETGAGKSIVIDALSCVLGARTSHDIVRSGTNKAIIRAVFETDKAADFLEENDIDASDEIILQRTITADGKSNCRVNGVPVTVGQLGALGALLLDIHGQNDGRKLADETRHLDYLDAFADLGEDRASYEAVYQAFCETKAKIAKLNMDESARDARIEQLKDAIAELSGAEISPGEEEELLARRDLLKNAGKLTQSLDGAYEAIYADDVSAISLCAEALSLTQYAQGYAADLEEASKVLREAKFLLEDAAERINDTRLLLDFSPEEYDRIETRLSLLKRLCKKYQQDEQGLADLIISCKAELDSIEFSDEALRQLQKELAECRKKTETAAKALSEKRKIAAKKLGDAIGGQLKYLSMPSARFVVGISEVHNENGFGAHGIDEVRFLISANAGEEPGRISKIASGGELSRIMLAMKSVFAKSDNIDSMVFDEIDTGVSGVAAQRVGEKMCLLSGGRQVICITHLPQIAALADVHFLISKTENASRTFTSVNALDRQGQVAELARLHGGDSVTQATLQSASDQLESADAFKLSKVK